MSVSLVMTIIGDDRPGLVGSVSEAVAAHGGSWQESQMARLAGKFAGILRVEVPADQAAALEASLHELSSSGLQVIVAPGHEDTLSQTRALVLELTGDDRPGIVRAISVALAARSVNIEALETERANAPMSGGLLFRATVRLRLPEGTGPEDLRESLEDLAHDLMVDILLDDGKLPPKD